jgi:hypothetical protein
VRLTNFKFVKYHVNLLIGSTLWKLAADDEDEFSKSQLRLAHLKLRKTGATSQEVEHIFLLPVSSFILL